MRRLLVLLATVTLLLAACGNDDDAAPGGGGSTDDVATDDGGATDDVATDGAAVGARSVVISAVSFGDAGVITLENIGDTDIDLTGHWLCNRPIYVEVPGGVLAPGESIEIPSSDLSLDPASGEVGLYSSNQFGSATAIIAYVEYGSPGRGREPTAVAGGVWTEGEFVDNGGEGFSLVGDDPRTGADYAVG